ncbi:hypothetical protein H4582DRAFT_628459 [Lactarius indigo]|nr:hypothetical protein H4582DRAFT_628459 [Lactarius indigo]
MPLMIVLNGNFEMIDGTSDSTPVRLSFFFSAVVNSREPSWPHDVQTVAGIISLLYDYLISKGERPLSFFNPWLYDKALPRLNDITSGWNPGCGTDGFPAIVR